MISDKFQSFYEKIIVKTKNATIKWRPIAEYFDNYVIEDEISEHFLIFKTAWAELHYDKSFYCYKDGKYLMLLCYRLESARDGSISEVVELIGSVSNGKHIMYFPEYIEGGFERIRDAISDYWELKKTNYNPDISDKFELLETFIKGD